MKTIKAICVSTLLALSLSIPALADTAPGDNHTPGSPTVTKTSSDLGTVTSTQVDIELSDAATVDAIVSLIFEDIFWTMTSIL